MINTNITAACILGLALVTAAYTYNYFSPYQSCMRSMMKRSSNAAGVVNIRSITGHCLSTH